MQQAPQRKDETRLRLLRVIYEITDGMPDRGIDIDEGIAGRIGVSMEETEGAANFLVSKGLLRIVTMAGMVMITGAGTEEAEASLRSPAGDTEHFPSSVKNSVHQRTIQELREKVTTLPPEQHEEAHSVIDQIEEMLEKGPKAWAAARMLITSLVTYWPDAVPWLTNMTRLLFGA